MNWARKYAALLVMVLGSMSHCMAATPDSCQTLRKHGQKTEAQACFESLVRSNYCLLPGGRLLGAGTV